MKSNDIKYCVWDVGKTIYPFSLQPLNQWAAEHTRSPEKYDEQNNIKFFDYDPYMAGKEDFETFCRNMCRKYDIPYTNSTRQEVNKALHAGVKPPYPETLAAMDMLKKRGIENCVLSNALPILGDSVPDFVPVNRKYAFTSYELGLLKPDKKIFEAVREKLGCEFGQIIFVDDKAENVKSAEDCGIRGIVCRHETLEKSPRNVLSGKTVLAPEKQKIY